MGAQSLASPAAKSSTCQTPAFASSSIFLSIRCQNLFPLNLTTFSAEPGDAGLEVMKSASSSFSTRQSRPLHWYAEPRPHETESNRLYRDSGRGMDLLSHGSLVWRP